MKQFVKALGTKTFNGAQIKQFVKDPNCDQSMTIYSELFMKRNCTH